MSRNKRQRQFMSMPPYSREAEYKYILKAVKEASSEVKEFHDYYLKGVQVEYAACTQCLDKLLEDWECDRSELVTWRDYINILKSKAVDRKLKETDAFADVRFICERISHFEGIFEEQAQKLLNCVKDHVYRYCVSFESETKGVEINCVKEYEESVNKNRLVIDEHFDELSTNLEKLSNITTPFYDFVATGNEHSAVMNDLCQTFFDICKTVKAWLKEDKGYAERIWQEMQTYMSNRERLRHEESKLTKQREGIMKHIDDLEKRKKSTFKKYELYKRERNRLGQRIEVVEFKLDRLKTTCDNKEIAYREIKEYKAIDNPLTPRKQISYDIQLEGLLRDIEEMDLQVEPTEKHLDALRKDLKEATHTTYELKVEAATLDNDQHDARRELPEVELETEAATNGVAENDTKIKTMEKIRTYIALAETLRKLHRDEKLEKATPEKDNLNEALEMVSQNLGKGWRPVYLKLPFVPRREDWQKSKDIQVLNMVAMRCDLTHEQEARKAFGKWLTFNRHGNLQQLIRTLRKVHKIELASYLEDKYIVDDVY